MSAARTMSAPPETAARAAAGSDARFAHVTFLGDRPENTAASAFRAGTARSVHVPAGERTLDEETARFFAELCSQGGVEAHRYRESILTRRRAACLRTLRAKEMTDAARSVRASPVSRDRAMSAVMIGVTSFFRDPAVFHALDEHLAAMAAHRGSLHALSVGCSDGAEVYSLAMLLAQRGVLERASLWGVDCRREAIELARHGVFSASAIENIPAPLRATYVRTHLRGGWGPSVKRAPTYRVVEEVRASCGWAVADAFNLPGPPTLPRVFDLVACRNMAIYLKTEAAEELWSVLAARLRMGGLLLVGKAERPVARGGFAWSRLAPCVYRKEDER